MFCTQGAEMSNVIENNLDSGALKDNQEKYCDGDVVSNSTKNTENKLPCVHYENSLGLSKDLSLLASMPELYDVHFLVGRKKQPVGAVRAILAARSRSVLRSSYLSKLN